MVSQTRTHEYKTIFGYNQFLNTTTRTYNYHNYDTSLTVGCLTPTTSIQDIPRKLRTLCLPGFF